MPDPVNNLRVRQKSAEDPRAPKGHSTQQHDPQANDRILGRFDVAEHTGTHITLRAEDYCSFWLDSTRSLPLLMARYLEAHMALVGPT